MTSLQPAIGKNRYCGPGALAIVTGLPTDEASRLIRTVNGKRRIFGVSPYDLRRAFMLAKVTLSDVPVAKGVSASWFVKDRIAHGWNGVYVLNVTGHYLVVEIRGDEAWACDNRTVYPVPFAKYSLRRKRIKQVWKVIQ